MPSISNISFSSPPGARSNQESSSSFVPKPASLSNSQDTRENITGYGKVEAVRSSYLARTSPYVGNPQPPKTWSPQEWAFLPEGRRGLLLQEKEEELQKLKQENGALKSARQILTDRINSLHPASSDLSFLETTPASSTSSSSDFLYSDSSCSSHSHSTGLPLAEMVRDDFSHFSLFSAPLNTTSNPVTATAPPSQAALQLQTLKEKEQMVKGLIPTVSIFNLAAAEPSIIINNTSNNN